MAQARPDHRLRPAPDRRRLIEDGTPERVDEEVLGTVDEAVAFADQSPFPAPESLYDDIYVLGDQVRGWYSVDERSAGAHRGEDERSSPETGDDERRRPSDGDSRRGCASQNPATTAADGGHALPRGAQRGAARGDAARRGRVPHGRGHRRVQRRLQGHQRPAGGVRRPARTRHPDLGELDRRHGRRRGHARTAPGGRAHDGELLAARAGPDRELGRAHPLHVRRPGARAAGHPHAPGRGPPARPDPLALLRGPVPARARPARGRALQRRRRQGAAQGRHPRRQPGDLHRARVPLRPARRCARVRRLHARLRPRTDRARGHGHHRRGDLAHGDDGREGSRRAGRRARHLLRGHRPAHIAPARPRHRGRVGAERPTAA